SLTPFELCTHSAFERRRCREERVSRRFVNLEHCAEVVVRKLRGRTQSYGAARLAHALLRRDGAGELCLCQRLMRGVIDAQPLDGVFRNWGGACSGSTTRNPSRQQALLRCYDVYG